MSFGRKTVSLGLPLTLIALAFLSSGCGSGRSGTQPTSQSSPPDLTTRPAVTEHDGSSPILTSVCAISGAEAWVAGDGIIVKTDDGGRSWQRQYQGSEWITHLDFVDGGHGWAVGRDSLLATSDGGRHWTALGEPEQRLWDVAFVDAAVGYGVTGGQRNPKPPQDHQYAELLAEVGGGGLVTTKDGGSTWTPVSTPTGVEVFAFESAAVGWVAGRDGIYATHDGGKTWARRGDFPRQASPVSPGEPVWLALESAGSDTLWAEIGYGRYAGGMGFALYRSSDGGTTWLSVTGSGRDQATAPGPLAVVDSGTAYLFGVQAGTWLTLGHTDDEGESWASTLPLAQTVAALPADASFVDSGHGWGVVRVMSDRTSTVIVTDDGGKTWRSATLSTREDTAASGDDGIEVVSPFLGMRRPRFRVGRRSGVGGRSRSGIRRRSGSRIGRRRRVRSRSRGRIRVRAGVRTSTAGAGGGGVIA